MGDQQRVVQVAGIGTIGTVTASQLGEVAAHVGKVAGLAGDAECQRCRTEQELHVTAGERMPSCVGLHGRELLGIVAREGLLGLRVAGSLFGSRRQLIVGRFQHARRLVVRCEARGAACIQVQRKALRAEQPQQRIGLLAGEFVTQLAEIQPTQAVLAVHQAVDEAAPPAGGEPAQR